MSSASEYMLRQKAMWEAMRRETTRIQKQMLDMTFDRFLQHLHEEKMFKMYGHRRNNYLFRTEWADRVWIGVDMAVGRDWTP